MKYSVTHTTKFAYTEAVPVCHNLIHLKPRSLPLQRCELHRLLVQPEPANMSQRVDYFGNPVSYFSVDQPHLRMTVTASSSIEVLERPMINPMMSPAWETIRDWVASDRSQVALEAYALTLPSKSVQSFAGLREFGLQSFTAERPLVASVIDLTSRIFHEFKYIPEATNIDTPISEVFEKRHGVCQDFAHFQIGCLRSLGLPARYVSGYLRTHPPEGKPKLIGADASHAWLSFFAGTELGWVDIDPTNNTLLTTDHITVAWGRDYGDVCPIQGVIVGGGVHRMTVAVDVSPQV